jgi:mannose-6-phosphate isomerase-like protein (cupin superfamily)
MLQAGIAINFAAALEDVTEYWSPRIIGQVNDQYVKVAKLKGEFTWHKHAAEDEMFFVVYGSLRIQFQDRADVVLRAGDFCIVPRDTMHNPVADEECGIALIETVSTLHTGDTVTPLTKSIDAQLNG